MLSGGSGNRLNEIGVPKQYYEINGKPILCYAVETIVKSNMIDEFIIVAAEEWHSFIENKLIGSKEKFTGFVLPGVNRQLSIYNGLVRLKDNASENDIVIIFDAARPCVSEHLLISCIKACEEADGAMPALPMKDTVYLSENGKTIDSLLNRAEIFAGQAPEAFVYGKYLTANKRILRNEIYKINGSTEPAILANLNIAIIKGEESNFKITTSEDLERFKRLLEVLN